MIGSGSDVCSTTTIRTDTAVHLCVESAQSDASSCSSSLWIFELRSEIKVTGHGHVRIKRG